MLPLLSIFDTIFDARLIASAQAWLAPLNLIKLNPDVEINQHTNGIKTYSAIVNSAAKRDYRLRHPQGRQACQDFPEAEGRKGTVRHGDYKISRMPP
jgi:hypothetical protein